jgi:hypothetical protein
MIDVLVHRCVEHREGCKGVLIVLNGEVLGEEGVHDEDPDPLLIAVKEVEMKAIDIVKGDLSVRVKRSVYVCTNEFIRL